MDRESEIELDRMECIHEMWLEKSCYTEEAFQEGIDKWNLHFDNILELELSGDMNND